MTTGNPTRDAMLRRAISECVSLKEALVIGNVMEKLPGDFFGKMDPEADAEFSDALRFMKLSPADASAPVAPEPVLRSTEAEQPTPVSEAEQPEAKISFELAQQQLQLAQARLDRARVALAVANEAGKKTRTTLAAAITAWQMQVDPLSPAERAEREKRNFLHSEQQRRAENPRRGITRGAAFVQKRMSPNGGNSRGAYPRQYQHRTVVPSGS